MPADTDDDRSSACSDQLISLPPPPPPPPLHRFELQHDPSFWKDNSVQVVIRIRPLSSSEISLQGRNACVRQDSCKTITWTGHPESRFTFDLIADEHVTQENLFKVAGVPMVENCIAGYNSCMFAYGQTGSGKTHTMLGDIENGTRRHSVNCGMTPRVFEYLFSRIQKEKETRRDEKLRFTCKCSFLEIYNEQILDLLNPTAVNLQIREDAKKGVYVDNLTEHEVSSARDAMHQLIQGAANRKVAATNMNRASSRSHSVFTCLIESKWESQGINHHRFSHLNLVDLAGSERQKSSGAEGERLKEATNINKSLSALGHVITSLIAVSNKKSQHVPYRDSKLTFLLQDSLGGNSKTTIIANISPSNCCAAETLSTLKFAQRAKYIRNNAIVNEDASGDIIRMRLRIQQLEKEVSHLRTEKQESAASGGALSYSPCSFKWEQGPDSFSPLMFDKRASKNKDNEVALVAAFRRVQEKETELKAIVAEKQIAEQLAAQRTEEVRSLKMRLRFREEENKRLKAVASGRLSAEAHFLQEKEELLEEVEVLRNQLDRNPEVTRFAMENLHLREELRRLKAFVDEGEREKMDEQIISLQHKLAEALGWKLMHEKGPDNQDLSLVGESADNEENEFFRLQDLSLVGESAGNEENEFLRLQAIQNEREIESLRKKLNFYLEEKEKLERRVDELVSQSEAEKKHDDLKRELQVVQVKESAEFDLDDVPDAQTQLNTMVAAIAAASQREAEAHETAIALAKENEELRIQLKALIEDDKRLVELYEHAIVNGEMNQDGNFPALSQTPRVEQQESNPPSDREHASCPTDPHGHDLSCDKVEHKIVDEKCNHENNPSRTEAVDSLQLQLEEMHEENEKLMSLYEKAMQERDEFKRKLVEQSNSESREDILLDEEPVEVHEVADAEKPPGNLEEEDAQEVLQLVQTKLERVQDRIVTTEGAVQYFELLEKASTKVHELSASAQLNRRGLQLEQEHINALKVVLSQAQERKYFLDGKYLEVAELSQSLNLKAQYLEREANARVKLDSNLEAVKQKDEQLRRLRTRKDELSAAFTKTRQSESELRNKIDGLKLKIHSAEARRKEAERVLFPIDNLDISNGLSQKPMNFFKASELLKSEEERTMLLSELKKAREQLVTVQKEMLNLKKCEDPDCEIACLETEMNDCWHSLLESEIQKFVCDKMLSEIREGVQKNVETLLLDYQECIFEVNSKREEIRVCDESLQHQIRSLDELHAELDVAMQNMGELLQDRRCMTACNVQESLLHVSEKAKKDLECIRIHVAEAKQLLLLDSQTSLQHAYVITSNN